VAAGPAADQQPLWRETSQRQATGRRRSSSRCRCWPRALPLHLSAWRRPSQPSQVRSFRLPLEGFAIAVFWKEQSAGGTPTRALHCMHLRTAPKSPAGNVGTSTLKSLVAASRAAAHSQCGEDSAAALDCCRATEQRLLDRLHPAAAAPSGCDDSQDSAAPLASLHPASGPGTRAFKELPWRRSMACCGPL